MTEVDRTDTPAILPYRGEDWDTLVNQSVSVFGADLEKGDTLIGVPFVMIRATIRPGDYQNAATGLNHPYASLDVIIGAQSEIDRAIRRGRITPEQASAVDPGEHLVVNEAGTGSYRQVVEYLEALAFVSLPDGPAAGKLGESRYDSLASAWEVHHGTVEINRDEGGEPTYTFDTRLFAPRGFRASDYENEYTKSGHTRYFG